MSQNAIVHKTHPDRFRFETIAIHQSFIVENSKPIIWFIIRYPKMAIVKISKRGNKILLQYFQFKHNVPIYHLDQQRPTLVFMFILYVKKRTKDTFFISEKYINIKDKDLCPAFLKRVDFFGKFLKIQRHHSSGCCGRTPRLKR